jgi:hypothetical protein
MNSHFKFPRRVRIHGGECGAVARALHHEVKGFSLYQADLGKAPGSTNERKQMSTKTTLKRIALVAVSALTGGLLAIVSAPVANATTAGLMEYPTSIATGTPGAARSGTMSYTDVVLNLPSTFALNDTVVVGAKLLTAPSTSTLATVAANPTTSGFTGVTNNLGVNLTWIAGASGVSGSYGTLSTVGTSGSGNATATVEYQAKTGDSIGQIKLRVGFKPDVAGTYTILVSTPKTGAGTTTYANYSPGATGNDLSTTFTVTTASAASTVTLSAVTSAARSGASVRGQLMKMTLADSTGAATLLGSLDQIVLSSNDTSVSFAEPAAAVSSSATTMTVTSSTTGWSGSTFYFRVDNASTTDESVTITATGGGGLSSAVTSNVGTSFTAAATTKSAVTLGLVTLDTSLKASTSATAPSCASIDTDDVCYTVSPADTSHAIRSTIGTIATYKSYWTVTDTSGKLTGFGGSIYTIPVSFASTATVAYVDTTFSAALLTTDAGLQSFSAVLYATGDPDFIIKSGAGAADDIDVTDDTRRVATGSTNTFVAALTDQYGAAIANSSITVTVAGRNGSVASSTIVTNADGEVTYSLTDTGTVGTTDTITFTSVSDSSVTGSATLTYGTTTVTTLSVYTAPHVAAGVADANIIYSDKKDIDASSKAGASATTQPVAVLAKDANGVVMSGVPVTFTIAGTGCGLLSTKGTVYTGADGLASTSIYAWLEGKCTVTATAGGQTTTTDAYFVQTGTGEARTITAAVSGGLVTATVKDRFGNPIKGVSVYATRTGEGYFGNGSSATSGTTGEAGTVEFYLNGNTAATTVTVQLGDATAASAEFGQSSADAGKYGTKSATQTAFTAYAAGTTTTAETGVGSSISPAGINSATVTVAAATNAAATAAEAATDAAAEAIDAANAATDAANLAAEAADAATVAAEEARDAADAATAAVEELATQVATLMAALKAQITTLANTVAKIAKKVKA